MPDEPMTAYCMKCREKRALQTPVAVYTRAGAPATSGTCPVCGTKLFKMGLTPAHAGVPKPVAAPTTPLQDAAAKPARTAKSAAKAAPKSSRKPASDQTAPARRADGKKLVIVESPTKARTVGRFLGKEYVVEASVGHIRDLPKSQLGVDVDAGFQPKYLVPKEKRDVVNKLKATAQSAAQVYLASDPDREGEAISWHLAQALGLGPDRYRRVVFHEITKQAVDEGFAHPRDIDMELVNAQQARRVLDRLVGYEISPLLWKNVQSRLSAGRVQSVALRLIVEREREIQAFVPVEYWSIEAELAKREALRRSFIAKLARIDDKEADLKNEQDTLAIVQELEKATYLVSKVDKGERRRFPGAPFTTSTLQQDANRRIGYPAKKTMALAQQLYEGIDIGEGQVGLITYMRTDSVNVAESAQNEARAYIGETYGAEFLPPQPPTYKTRAKKAQEAHEAIRPTSVRRTPDALKPHLSAEQHRLYELIWRRFVASQMVPALYDTTSVDIKAGQPQPPAALGQNGAVPSGKLADVTANWRYLFRANGAVLRFPGFLKVYGLEAGAADEEGEEETGGALPPLTVGELLDLLKLLPEQHFTQPPPRYTEATLVRKLEELGIGRPSTYAPTLSTIQTRGYVERQGKALAPTPIGFTVTDLLVQHFPAILDYDFTAHMEQDLDDIAEGDRDWVAVLQEFYAPFAQSLAAAQAKMPKVETAPKPPPEETDEICPQCGGKIVIRTGRFGRFKSCSNFPKCKYTAPVVVTTGAKCPQCGGDLRELRSRRGSTFYGCSRYPECKFTTSNRPLPEPCVKCGGLLVDAGKKGIICLKCGQTTPAADPAETAQEG